MVSPIPFSAGIDLANLGFGIYDRIMGDGSSDTARNDTRFMNDFAWKAALRNEDYQRNYMQVRARDAELAGMHPLAALGVNVGSGPSGAAFVGTESFSGNKAFGDMSHLGQNTARALLAQSTADERALNAATINKLNSEADFAQASAKEVRSRVPNTQLPPPMPNMATSNKYQLVKNAMGRYEWILSPEASQGIMSDPIKMWATSLENSFAGPDTYPFWRSVGRGARRLMSPRRSIMRGD